MATRKQQPRSRASRDDIEATSPSQQDEADILEEAEGETDDESGETLVDEEKVQELGAVDATSVRENRRNKSLVGKKRANVKNVSFNTGDPLTSYENAIRTWPPNTMYINVRRLTGASVTRVIPLGPKSGPDLYSELMRLHGQYEEAEYEIRCFDTVSKQFRMTSRIWLPDTRPQQPQQGQQMGPYYPPQPPPGYLPPGYSPPLPPPPVAQVSPSPSVLLPPGTPDLHAVMSAFQQMLEMTRQVHPPAAPGPQQPDTQAILLAFKQALEGGAQQAQPVATQPAQLPAGPPGTVWVPQWNAFVPIEAISRAMNPHPEPPPPAPPPPPVVPNVEAPPGHVWVAQFNAFVPIAALARALDPDPQPPPRPEPRPQYRPPPEYGQGYGQGERPLRPPPYGGHQMPQQRQQQTPTDQLKEAMGTLRAAAGMIKEFNSILPSDSSGGGYDEPPVERGIVSSNDEDSPVRIVDTGHGRLAMGRDGKVRVTESVFANLDGIMKFVGDTAEGFQRRAQQNRSVPQRRQLPPGYVEVGPGYQPPPGYRAVPVDQNDLPPIEQNDLPPAPDPLPPPIGAPRSWGMPAIREE